MNIHSTETRILVIGRWATFFRVRCRAARGTTNKRALKVSNLPLRPENTPFGPPTKFGVWAKFTDVINCGKFHLHWFSLLWALGFENPNLPFVWVTALTNNFKRNFSLKQSVWAVRSYMWNSKYHFVKIRGKEDQQLLLLQIDGAPKKSVWLMP